MLAHVDHGKSALSDCLISANGIISARSAGKVRYMDSREDEQRRGITMKSSSIALGHRQSEESPLNIVNLIDSPGHVDFSGEVETALRICDGAIIVVDVVEGVCVQTVSVLRAALQHALRPILVLNKLDRLFAELHLDPMEAYQHIVNILEQVNVIMGVRQVEEMIAAVDLDPDENSQSSDWQFNDTLPREKKAISGYFSPELGNVVFASAIDGWAFRIVDFARIFSERFGLSENILTKTLWGDHYLQSKSKRIVRKKPAEAARTNAKPMFVQFILSNVHAIYDALLSSQNDHDLAIKMRQKFVDKLKLKVTARDLKHRDTSTALHSIMSAWLPAAACLLNTVIEQLPSARDAQGQNDRLNAIWPHKDKASKGETVEDSSRSEHFKRQYDAISSASTGPGAPVIGYVAKMIEAENEDPSNAKGRSVPSDKTEPEEGQNSTGSAANSESAKDDIDGNDKIPMVALARIHSGTIREGDGLYVYSPKYMVQDDGSFDPSTVSKATVTGLSLLMGRSTNKINSVSAGTVVGIHGLDDVVLKSATLSTEAPGLCLPIGSTSAFTLGLEKEAVVRVAIEPHAPKDLPKLQNGLRKLNQADPAVETLITAKGEHVIAAHGELHLERCLKDLRERFAKGVRIHVSKPIVSFRESVCGGFSRNVEVPKADENATGGEGGKENQDGHRKDTANTGGFTMRVETQPEAAISKVWDTAMVNHGRMIRAGNESVSFKITAAPLPLALSKELDDLGAQLKQAEGDAEKVEEILLDGKARIEKSLKEYAGERWSDKQAERAVQYWLKKLFPRVWVCGPRDISANFFIGPSVGTVARSTAVKRLFGDDSTQEGNGASAFQDEIEKAMVAGFQLAVRAGPLCEEPMYGVAVLVEELNIVDPSVTAKEDSGTNTLGGMVIGWMREAVRLSVMHGNARVLEGMLHVDISVPGDVLGKTYTVIGQRRGRVLNEDMKEGVHVFGIEAYIPVDESFGFTDLLRKHTSGFAVPQMVFSHWEMVDMDPFWFAQTEEELEDLGMADATAEQNNIARKLINSVRRRKGLKVDEKIVENAEKQRTLSRKK